MLESKAMYLEFRALRDYEDKWPTMSKCIVLLRGPNGLLGYLGLNGEKEAIVTDLELVPTLYLGPLPGAGDCTPREFCFYTSTSGDNNSALQWFNEKNVATTKFVFKGATTAAHLFQENDGGSFVKLPSKFLSLRKDEVRRFKEVPDTDRANARHVVASKDVNWSNITMIIFVPDKSLIEKSKSKSKRERPRLRAVRDKLLGTANTRSSE